MVISRHLQPRCWSLPLEILAAERAKAAIRIILMRVRSPSERHSRWMLGSWSRPVGRHPTPPSAAGPSRPWLEFGLDRAPASLRRQQRLRLRLGRAGLLMFGNSSGLAVGAAGAERQSLRLGARGDATVAAADAIGLRVSLTAVGGTSTLSRAAGLAPRRGRSGERRRGVERGRHRRDAARAVGPPTRDRGVASRAYAQAQHDGSRQSRTSAKGATPRCLARHDRTGE